MSKKISYVAISLVCVFSLLGVSNAMAKSEDEGREIGEQHKSEVSGVVRELLKVADRDKQIGDEVKEVAESEEDQSEGIKEKMNKVEQRSRLKTFFIGSDYKNLGQLRSELVTTENNLERLNKSMERTTSATIKTDLENQIKNLQTIKEKADLFVKNNENRFSLFGWFLKLFSK